MNVIPSNIKANVLEPIFSDDLKSVVNYSSSPVVGWMVTDSGHVAPLSCMGQPEGHYMVRFFDVDDSRFYIPGMLESFNPWITEIYRDTKEEFKKLDKEMVIAKFQHLFDIA